MKLEHFLQTMVVVSYDDLEDFIKETYNIDEVELVATEEWGNGESHEYDVAKDDLDEYYVKKLQEFKDGKMPSFILQTILKDLCNNDHIDEGKYLITVSW